jgi:hypothetical protein
MKRIARPDRPDTARIESKDSPLSILSRIQLAFLEDYSRERQGYDPYDSSKSRSPDVWALKRKRA